MLHLLYRPTLDQEEPKVFTPSKLNFSFTSILAPDRLKLEPGPNHESLNNNQTELTSFTSDLRLALPDSSEFGKRPVQEVMYTTVGVPTFFVRSLPAFLRSLHRRELVTDIMELDNFDLPRIFLRLVTQGFLALCRATVQGARHLDGEKGSKFTPNFGRTLGLPRTPSFGDHGAVAMGVPGRFHQPERKLSVGELTRRQPPFQYEVVPEWRVPTLPHVGVRFDGASEWMPSGAYLASYFGRVAMGGGGRHAVPVPTLAGEMATVHLTPPGFGMVRSNTVFSEVATDEPPSGFGLGFVEAWFGLPGLRLMNYFKGMLRPAQGNRARVGILSGSSGIGKSMLVSRLAQGLRLSCHVAYPATGSLRDAFSRAVSQPAPAVLVLEGAHRSYFETALDGVELLSLMGQHPGVMVLGVTTRPSELNPAFVASSDFHIELEPPTSLQRGAMLKGIVASSVAPDAIPDSALFARVAEACPGYLLADLWTLAKAALVEGPPQLGHFLAAKRLIQPPHPLPQAQRIPAVRFDEVGGLDGVKAALRRLALRLVGSAQGIPAGGGALLYGPPGTGKTLLGKALATEANANFLPVRIPDLIRGEVGASEEQLTRLFAQARASSPCILFFDELDGLFVNRANSSSPHASRLVAQFLLELDDVDGVLVLATTNHPLAIDRSERLGIVKLLFPSLGGDAELLDRVVRVTEGFTGADLSALKHRAQVLAHPRSGSLTSEDVLAALDPSSPCPLLPSVSAAQLEEFRAFQFPR
ncbi:hypothetical protein L0F63_003171 [Massospora cicadina]|nr:hypothetical protein L0F63_003171 [Massospora cicadina]